jgi:hypothetical protein
MSTEASAADRTRLRNEMDVGIVCPIFVSQRISGILYCAYCRGWHNTDQFSAQQARLCVADDKRYCRKWSTPQSRESVEPNITALPSEVYKLSKALKMRFVGQDEWEEQEAASKSRTSRNSQRATAEASSVGDDAASSGFSQSNALVIANNSTCDRPPTAAATGEKSNAYEFFKRATLLDDEFGSYMEQSSSASEEDSSYAPSVSDDGSITSITDRQLGAVALMELNELRDAADTDAANAMLQRLLAHSARNDDFSVRRWDEDSIEWKSKSAVGDPNEWLLMLDNIPASYKRKAAAQADLENIDHILENPDPADCDMPFFEQNVSTMRHVRQKLAKIAAGDVGYADLARAHFKTTANVSIVNGRKRSCGQDALIMGGRMLGVKIVQKQVCRRATVHTISDSDYNVIAYRCTMRCHLLST